MDMPHVTQLERRRIEAEILVEAYGALRARMSEEDALQVIRDTTAAAARRAGEAFAWYAPQRVPSLEHFATVVNLWRAGGALDVEKASLDGDELRVTVSRCGYVDMYVQDMRLTRELCQALSCSRDAAFAAGYSPRLTMERPGTIAQGMDKCEFLFHWDGKG